MADNFPLSTWDGVNSPWQNIQNWRVYGHSGSGTSNTGFRNYGATGVNTSYGTGVGETGFKGGMSVQRTQFRSPSAGVSQRFNRGEQLLSFNTTPVAPKIRQSLKEAQGMGISLSAESEEEESTQQKTTKTKQGSNPAPQGKLSFGQRIRRFGEVALTGTSTVRPPEPEPERVVTDDPVVLARQQKGREARAAREAGTLNTFFQPEERPVVPMTETPRSFTPDIPQYTPEQRRQMAAEQRQRLGMPPRQPVQQPAPFVPTPLQERVIKGVAEMKAQMTKGPAAEKSSTSRTSKRARKSAIGVWGQNRINEELELG